MRESIGGTLLLWIVIFLFSIFIAFLAAVVQYARVYKIKNSVVNYLERSEGISSLDEFENILDNYGYTSDKYVVCRYIAPNRGGYYYVKLYATFSLLSIDLDIKIKGESRLVETGVLVKGDGLFEDTEGSGQASCIGNQRYIDEEDLYFYGTGQQF